MPREELSHEVEGIRIDKRFITLQIHHNISIVPGSYLVRATKAGYESWNQPPDFSSGAVVACPTR